MASGVPVVLTSRHGVDMNLFAWKSYAADVRSCNKRVKLSSCFMKQHEKSVCPIVSEADLCACSYGCKKGSK